MISSILKTPKGNFIGSNVKPVAEHYDHYSFAVEYSDRRELPVTIFARFFRGESIYG